MSKEKPKITRHPSAIAWDEFLRRNPDTFDADTLGSTSPSFYLKNRLQSAFFAGMEAQEKLAKEKRP